MDKHTLPELFAAMVTFVAGLTPAALGAAVSLAYERGLTWRDRFIQFAVGVVVSYFAGGVTAVIWAFFFKNAIDPFVLQGFQFTFGMIAFKATPQFITAASEAIAGLPSMVRDRLVTWLPKKKDDAQ
ncbi:hypothetical protein NDN01_10000 [Sphingomonas sp. QA11]|uniref:hypothetical protein n=1 Tax=Sphingomonas sp. QA11 TaxID=2950605 RepID=UPI00234B6725|nr:hypothetical protein [Sphingomonas sp. QA11]WCM29186.1 hypothetical protein NDN01_10000 [Sphingomonas sp. QA11]